MSKPKRKVGLFGKTAETVSPLTGFKFKNGEKVRDQVTGFEGTVTSRTEYLNGCIRYGVQGVIDKKDSQKVPDPYMFDEAQLEAVPVKPEKAVNVKPARTGGPRGSNAKDLYRF